MPVPGGGGGGGTVDSSDRNDRMGAKIKTQKQSLHQNLTHKKSHAKFLSHKNNLFAELCSWDM